MSACMVQVLIDSSSVLQGLGSSSGPTAPPSSDIAVPEKRPKTDIFNTIPEISQRTTHTILEKPAIGHKEISYFRRQSGPDEGYWCESRWGNFGRHGS